MFITVFSRVQSATGLYPEPDEYSPHLLRIHFNIIHPLKPTPPKWSLPLWFSDKNSERIIPLDPAFTLSVCSSLTMRDQALSRVQLQIENTQT